MIWNGHELVSTGHPEDDDPWCKNCGLAASDEQAQIPCRKDPTMTYAHPDEELFADDDDRADAVADEGHERLQAQFRANVMDVSEITAIDNGTELDAIAQAKDVVRETYDMILAALALRRTERDAIEDTIAELVLAEALWKPLVYRLDHGPARRKRAEAADG